VVKATTSRGLFAKMLAVEIVCMVFVLLQRRSGSLLQECHRTRASRSWAVLGHRDAHTPAPCAGPAGQIELRLAPFLFQVLANLVSKLNL